MFLLATVVVKLSTPAVARRAVNLEHCYELFAPSNPRIPVSSLFWAVLRVPLMFRTERAAR
jgi:hypothetical protein